MICGRNLTCMTRCPSLSLFGVAPSNWRTPSEGAFPASCVDMSMTYPCRNQQNYLKTISNNLGIIAKSCNVTFDQNHNITLFCSFSFFFCCQTSYARVIMDRSRPTRVAKKIPPSDCRVIPLESSVMGHVWRYLLFQYVANTKNTKSTM